MIEQLILDLPFRNAMGRADFYITEANTPAVAAIDGWRGWPYGKLLLVGPTGSGKTHLAHVFAAQTGARILQAATVTEGDVAAMTDTTCAVVLEGLDRAVGAREREEVLFHLHNALVQHGAPVLMTASCVPTEWRVSLPDLLSRVQQADLVRIAAPDDVLMSAVMIKQAQDRGIVLPHAVVRYAILRLDRSLAGVARFVAALDRETMAAGEKPGVKHARAILERMTPSGDAP